MKGLTVVAVTFALFGFAGCGGSDSDSGGSDEDQVSAVVSDFSDNIADGDYAAACDMYDSEAVEFFETQGQIPGGCEGLTEATFGSLSEDQVAGIEAESIDIEGDMATVQLVNGDEFGLRKEGDGWVMTLD